MNDLPKSRSEAKSLGLKHYFTGNACPNGHTSPRYTSTSNCVACLADHNSKRLDYYRERYQGDKDKLLAQQKARYEIKKEEIIKYVKQWVIRNKDLSREIKRKYKTRRRSQQEGGASAKDVLLWKRDQKNICYWCGVRCDDEPTVDHYYPLSKGGSHELDNLVIACRKCNTRKNAKDPYEFAISVGRLF